MSTTRITWWEAAELLEHLASRPDIWTRGTTLWTRCDADGPLCSIALLPPAAENTSQFRMFTLQSADHAWSPEDTDTYVAWLLSHWTTYDQRMNVEAFLVDSLQIEPETASLSAIAICSFEWMPKVDEPPLPLIQADLWPDRVPSPGATFAGRDFGAVGTYLLNGGAGWVKLRRSGGMLRVMLSLRDAVGQPLSLDGFVRPDVGTLDEAVERLRGDELPAAKREPEPEPDEEQERLTFPNPEDVP